MKKIFLLLLLWAIILCIPMFFSGLGGLPRLDTDYDSNLPIYQYILSFAYLHHSLPLIIPLVATGIPILGDPLNAFLNPLLGLPLFLFGLSIGLKVSILLSCLLSGISMFFLLQNLKLKKIVSLWGSYLYMSGGAFFAAVASGHIEKFLVYPFVPLLLLFSLRKEFSLKTAVIVGLIFSATIYSGDMYNTWFFFLIFSTNRLYCFFQENKLQQISLFCVSLLFFILFSLPKLVSFILYVLPVMQRYNSIDGFRGSLQFFLFPLSFLMPLGVCFWDRPFFQRHLGFYYNWYEYFAFLSPIPFVFFFKIKKIFSQQYIKILLSIIFVGICYFSLAYPYSPFFWLFHLTPLASFFRVPQRIVLPMTSVVVVLLAACINVYVVQAKRGMLLLIVLVTTLIWTMFVDWNILYQTFPKQDLSAKSFIHTFAEVNSTRQPIVDFVPSTQLFLIQENVPIKNYYYGWVPKGTETYNETTTPDFVKLLYEKPFYVMTKRYISLVPYGYKIVLKNSTIAIWQKM